jgi:putative transposase
MPRTARSSCGGLCYHAMSRGNRRETVFHDEEDYAAFVAILRRACERISMRLLAWCLMPNHFHLVLWPHADGDLSRWMHWLLTTHVQRQRRRHGTIGRIWQGRFKAPPIQQDRHLLIVMRYTERNPLRAGLVERAEEWRWSSLRLRSGEPDVLLTPSPVPVGADWCEQVNRPLTARELDAVRTSVQRGRPFGGAAWTRGTSERLDLLDSLNPRGRPPRFPRTGETEHEN